MHIYYVKFKQDSHTAKTEVVISPFEVGNSHSAPLPLWWFEVKSNVALFLVLNNHRNEVVRSM